MIGFTVGLGILLVVYSQYRFDAFHRNGKNIYEVYQQVLTKEKGEEFINALSYAAGPAYNSPNAVEKMTRVTDAGNHMQYNGKELLMPVMMADKDFFTMFSFDVVAGNQQTPLGQMDGAVLTQDAAARIFGDTDPIGKAIQAFAGEQLKTYTVTAVIKKPTA